MTHGKKLPQGYRPTNYEKDTCRTGLDAKNLGNFAKDKNSHKSGSKK